MNHQVRSLAAAAITVTALTALPAGVSNAEPCLSGGGRVYTYCASVPNAVAGFVPSPGFYAPLPSDPVPPSNVNSCVSYNARWALAGGCS